jgi:hypothetical protein
MREIDEAIMPPMDARDALDILETMLDEIGARVDGLQSDLGGD